MSIVEGFVEEGARGISWQWWWILLILAVVVAILYVVFRTIRKRWKEQFIDVAFNQEFLMPPVLAPFVAVLVCPLGVLYQQREEQGEKDEAKEIKKVIGLLLKFLDKIPSELKDDKEITAKLAELKKLLGTILKAGKITAADVENILKILKSLNERLDKKKGELEDEKDKLEDEKDDLEEEKDDEDTKEQRKREIDKRLKEIEGRIREIDWLLKWIKEDIQTQFLEPLFAFLKALMKALKNGTIVSVSLKWDAAKRQWVITIGIKDEEEVTLPWNCTPLLIPCPDIVIKKSCKIRIYSDRKGNTIIEIDPEDSIYIDMPCDIPDFYVGKAVIKPDGSAEIYGKNDDGEEIKVTISRNEEGKTVIRYYKKKKGGGYEDKPYYERTV